MVKANSTHEKSVADLLVETPLKRRCPHLRTDEQGPFCGKGFDSSKPVSEERRMVCSLASLQLYCLDEERYEKCIFYQGEKIKEI